MDDRFQDTHFPRGALHTNNVTVTTVQCTGYVLLAVTSIAMIVRYGALIRRFRDLKAEDYLLLVAYAFFVELTVLYIIISPVIFRLAALQAGLIKPYPSLPQDGLKLQIYYFVTTSSLWLCLWMVKFSLLSMYKRFLSGRTYVIAWWTIMIFCILFLIGCILSSWFSCSSFHAWFTFGKCDTPRDHRAAAISLYYSYAVDLITDFAIMVLPIRLIWNLQMKRSQKLSIGGLFCIGWICIIVATVRVAQLGSNSDSGTPLPSWLALWAIIEASIAVIIGNSPGLYRALKARFAPSQRSYQYGPYDYRRPTASGTNQRGIPLSRFSGTRPMSTSSSRKKLANPEERDITVTSHVTVTVGDRNSLDSEEIYGVRR